MGVGANKNQEDGHVLGVAYRTHPISRGGLAPDLGTLEAHHAQRGDRPPRRRGRRRERPATREQVEGWLFEGSTADGRVTRNPFGTTEETLE